MRRFFLIIAVWLMMAGLVLTPLQIFGQTRIAVISDPHVISEELAENPDAWGTTVSGSRKLLDYSKEVFDVLMAKFASEKPDILLISGDLTEDGGLKSHNYVADELAKLEAAGVKVYVIPGNHDISKAMSTSSFKEKYQAFGYDEGSEKDANSLSYACEPEPGLILIGIDSHHNGELPEGTLNWVCTQAEKARLTGKQVIAMMHHPLFPHINGANLFIDTYTVADYETVRNRLANAGVKVILTGHFHFTDNAKDWNADKAEIYDLNTGSTISYPCDYRMLTLALDGDSPSLTVKKFRVTEVPSYEGNFQEMAKERLATSTKSQLQNKLSTNSLATILTDEQKLELANLATDLIVVHAEGDEQDSPNKDEIKARYDAFKNSLDFISKMALSVIGDPLFNGALENTSNYGTDHAFQCADDDLSIDLPDLRESVTLAADGWASFSSTRDLTLPEDGLKGYIVTAVSSTSATLQEVAEVPANTGILLQGESGGTYRLTNATEVLETLADNLLLPALEETEAPGNAFVLARKNNNTGFYPVQQGVKIPAKKAYLIGNGSNAARMLSIDTNDGATGINSLAEESAPAVYTLQGVRIAHPQKGINIKNGKLIMVK